MARALGYPMSRPPSYEARIDYLERMVEWLAEELEDARGLASEAMAKVEELWHEDAEPVLPSGRRAA